LAGIHARQALRRARGGRQNGRRIQSMWRIKARRLRGPVAA
jgi:hypothetical protein